MQEKSVTRDTVCFGASDTLAVVVFKDSTTLDIDYVTVQPENDQLTSLQGNSSEANRLRSPVTVWRRKQDAVDFIQAGEISLPSAFYYVSDELSTDEVVYDYQVRAQNQCGEAIESAIHHTILLQGEADEANNRVSLRWNQYEGWGEPATITYFLTRRLDDEQAFTRLAIQKGREVPGSPMRYEADNGLDGFVHHYRIEARDLQNRYTSFSNEIQLEFKHGLVIPNVMTPNGDGLNDAFRIKNLGLFPDNQLTIYNRWGREIYHRQGYDNDWNAERLPTGLYYYQLTVARLGQVYHGWVDVLR